MVDVDLLRLSLPAGFERRALRIGRLTAEALAARLPPGGGSIAVLTLPALTIGTAWSDRRIADHLAGAIHRGIASKGGGR